MPRRSTHLTIGILVSIGFSLLLQSSEEPDEARWWRALGATGGGALGSVLPDVLEPAASLGPNHRGLMHSVTVAVLGGSLSWREGVRQLGDSANEAFRMAHDPARPLKARAAHVWDARLGWFMQGGLLGFGLGYGSHLLLDGRTVKSLPLIGLKRTA